MSVIKKVDLKAIFDDIGEKADQITIDALKEGEEIRRADELTKVLEQILELLKNVNSTLLCIEEKIY